MIEVVENVRLPLFTLFLTLFFPASMFMYAPHMDRYEKMRQTCARKMHSWKVLLRSRRFAAFYVHWGNKMCDNSEKLHPTKSENYYGSCSVIGLRLHNGNDTHTHKNLEWETTSVQMHSRKKCTKWHSNRTYSHIIQNSFYLSHACHQITHIPCNILVVCTHTTHTTHTLEWSNRARLGGLFGRLTRHKSIGSVLWDSRLLWDEWQLLSQNVQLTAFCTPLLKPIHFVNIINSSYERKIHITRTNRITIFHSVYPKIG